LTNLHQMTIQTEDASRLFQKVLAEEVEPSIKELSNALLHAHGSRTELESAVNSFEATLQRMRAAHSAMKAGVVHVKEAGERAPTH